MKITKISVILQVFNGENTIKNAINSILNQSYSDFELIIIDDGSSDRTLEIIKKVANIDQRIKIIKNSKNIGPTSSINKGIRIAKGEFIARQDAPDFSLPNRFEKQLKFLQENVDYSFCGSNIIIKQNKHSSIKIFEESDIRKKLIINNCFVHSTIFIRKDVFDRFGLYNEKYTNGQDYELWCRLVYKHSLKARNLYDRLVIIDNPQNKLKKKKKSKFLTQRKNNIKIKIKNIKFAPYKLKGLFSILINLLSFFYVFLFNWN